MSKTVSPRRVAYLTGVYPKASHTFIQREVAALRALGAEILTTSIRRPDEVELIGPEEVSGERETFYVLEAAKRPSVLIAAHAMLVMRRPGRWIRTLALALRSGRPGVKGFLWQLFYFLEAGVLARHLGQQKAEHLHNHFADSSASVAMLAAELAAIPFSFTLHGPTEFFAPESWHLHTKIARARLVMCISHFARSQAMIFSAPEDWPKLRIVHCGVDPERYDDKDNREMRRGRGLNLLFVGRLTQLKGLRVLFEAVERVKSGNVDINLTVIGDGPDRKWAEAEALRLGCVEMLGYRAQEEVARALSRCDALVLPSFAEGLPVVFMEALAARRPVIASRVAGVGELVEDGVSGLLVAPGDVDGLVRAIRTLEADPEGRAAMGEHGRRRVVAEFESMREAAWLFALFNDEAGNTLRPPEGGARSSA